jgi:nifR3 family TIM-barrel protein
VTDDIPPHPAAPVAALPALPLGPHRIEPPVVLAPMAGVTNVAYRQVCNEYGAGLCVSEMITTRGLVENDRTTRSMITFSPGESPRSVQFYGVDPVVVGAAVRIVREEGLADHIDLNFGCPVPKVTRKGGGSALPYKRRLFAAVIEAAVGEAGPLPVTVKMRKGIDDDHLTFLEAGRIAQDCGVAWVALHARTAAQFYGGQADWQAIAALKEALQIPVLGNGDIWTGADALEMVAQTGCDGIVVGRGCLGRPWLFAELRAAFTGQPIPPPPTLADVIVVMTRHADLLVAAFGETKGCIELRKHIAWYLKGFAVGGTTRLALAHLSSRDELADLLGSLDSEQELPAEIAAAPRGRTNTAKRVALPDGWLNDPDDDLVPTGAELAHSGG